jgi:hypothetical protein
VVYNLELPDKNTTMTDNTLQYAFTVDTWDMVTEDEMAPDVAENYMTVKVVADSAQSAIEKACTLTGREYGQIKDISEGETK